MYLKQGDIFWGVGAECGKKIVDFSRKESFQEGHILFKEGDPAERFYSLVKGCVKLRISKIGQTVYTVSRAGEAFGWSSLIGREFYSATAEIKEPSILMVIEREGLQKILEDNPSDGLILFRNLSKTLGSRLMQSYELIARAQQETLSASYGTGQVQEGVTA
jgi:CRP-like cAMP-binding protein